MIRDVAAVDHISQAVHDNNKVSYVQNYIGLYTGVFYTSALIDVSELSSPIDSNKPLCDLPGSPPAD